ncbi:MAG: hypothetical protein GC184_13440 [Rhizobiales bacterium]|nr:hypothetical protein [Hyphomicrobiales bacterium]
MLTLTIFALTVATGIVASGLTGSFYRLITNKPPSFSMPAETTLGLLAAIFMLIFAGPLVILRNALRAQVFENRPPAWLFLSAMISLGWAFLSGILLLSILLTL